MKITEVRIPWSEGLHLRWAAKLVQLAKGFQSRIQVRHGSLRAEASSILSLVLLCAAMNSTLEVEVSGVDEGEAVEAIQKFFGDGEG